MNDGYTVIGIDSFSDYYSVSLKEDRHQLLRQHPAFQEVRDSIETEGLLTDLCRDTRPDLIIHLAAQAGVRHSIENPRSYVQSNLCGVLEVLEAARQHAPSHLLMASTSSAYGANSDMPFRETVKTDHQMSFYAATKKAGESMAHSYAHLYDIPVTMFRFFTVYGPWGRPDMAYFKFVKAIENGQPIDVYNNGEMKRDFTYIDDLVEALTRLKDVPPVIGKGVDADSLSPVAPWRTINIGHGQPEDLSRFIEAIETGLGKTAQQNRMPMQPGDVHATWADTSLLKQLVGELPKTSLNAGMAAFIDWYRSYYS